jgi:hypothetical protein
VLPVLQSHHLQQHSSPEVIPLCGTAKCHKAKNILASSILDDAISHCTNSEELKFNNTSLLVFHYNFDQEQIFLQFEEQKVHFLLQERISLHSGQIKELNLNFVTNLQTIPTLSSELQDCIAVAPDLQFAPQLCIGSINIANCSTEIVELPANSILISLEFLSEQIVGIYRKLGDILSTQKLDRNIVNYSFLKSTAQTIAKVATKGYDKELTSFHAKAKKPKDKKHGDTETPSTPQNHSPNDIFTLDNRNTNIVLQSATLLNGLLHKGFSCQPSDIQQLQLSDL